MVPQPPREDAETPAERQFLRPVWQTLLPEGWLLGTLLVLAWGIPRFALVLGANVSGNYRGVSLIFVSMWVAPFVLLVKPGRKAIGICRPHRWRWVLWGFLIGLTYCALMYWAATFLYADELKNWFVYISRSFADVPTELTAADKRIYFVIYAVISMTFSPIGEELFYRGLVHQSFAASWGHRKASIGDSLAFSLTHLAHFGIVYVAATWRFWIVPGLLWVGFLIGLSLVFSQVRQKSGSILGAIACHAGYNLAMTYFIFFHVL